MSTIRPGAGYRIALQYPPPLEVHFPFTRARRRTGFGRPWKLPRARIFAVAHLTRSAIGLLALTVFAAVSATVGASSARTNGCDLSPANQLWLQRAVDGWDMVRRDFLKVPASPLPWIVLFDASCIWHLNPTDPRLLSDARQLPASTLTFDGSGVDIRAVPHSGTVLLPNRVEIPIEVKASTALYRNGRMTFLVMSMPSVWRAHRGAKIAYLDEYLQGAFTHEMTHTQQLVQINRRLRQLIGSTELLGRLTDDVIQDRFQKEQGFTRLIERERDMLFRAAGLTDPALRREIAIKALAMIRDRHARYYSGRNTPYAEIETLFLTMEGAGQWAAYKLIKARGVVGSSDAEVLKLVRDNRRYWSQDQGLALFLLLDVMVPNWQARIFQNEPASPFTLLEEALAKPKE